MAGAARGAKHCFRSQSAYRSCMPRFAANISWLFQELPAADRLRAARDCGFGAVEMMFPYDAPASLWAERLEEAGLAMVLINAPSGDWGGGERGFASLHGRERDFDISLERALAYARALKTKMIHVLAGRSDGGPLAERTYRMNLTRAAERAAAEGVTLLIEPLNHADAPRYHLTRLAHAASVLEDLGRSNLKLQFDAYHVQRTEGAVIERFRRYLPLIGHVQIAGPPDRGPPDQGELNYDWLLEQFDVAGYEGWVGCEYRPAGPTAEGLGWGRRWGLGA